MSMTLQDVVGHAVQAYGCGAAAVHSAWPNGDGRCCDTGSQKPTTFSSSQHFARGTRRPWTRSSCLFRRRGASCRFSIMRDQPDLPRHLPRERARAQW
ncbi:hypothetical protein BGW80DRAFT_1335277 [Lactifluus volemus]|nr:hypothetical protein BGW80DRAFT_1335277 [Lactifluus volemus]